MRFSKVLLVVSAFATILQLVLSGTWDTDFTNGESGVWHNLEDDHLKWTPTRGAPYGPQEDHTNGKGAYIYLMSRGNADRSYLLGEKWISPDSMPRCLHFYYAVYGEPRSSLMVTLQPKHKSYYPMFIVNSTHVGGLAKHWLRADVQLTGETRNSTAAFKGVFTTGTKVSGIALDDISMTRGICECHDSLPGACPVWGKRGACYSNFRWMSKYCRKTCKTCSCKDSSKRCVGWKLEGKCKEPDVEFECPYACTLCHCRDLKACKTMKKYCKKQKHRKYMRRNCQRTCGLCRK